MILTRTYGGDVRAERSSFTTSLPAMNPMRLSYARKAETVRKGYEKNSNLDEPSTTLKTLLM